MTYNAANDNKISGGQWTDLEIKLADLTDLSSTANIGQIVISSQTDGARLGRDPVPRQHLLQQDLQWFDFSEWTSTGTTWTNRV